MGSGSGKNLNLKLKIWRQKSNKSEGHLVDYDAPGVSEDASFLEMLDQVNEKLVLKGEEPVTFDHDCREGICGTCGFVINGEAHGPQKNTTVCQLHMRNFKDGDRLSSLGDSVLRAENATAIEQANMISDQARIYKGGSWRDRAYWLNPANRRYLDENKCSNDIGFRCAMSSVGGKKQN